MTAETEEARPRASGEAAPQQLWVLAVLATLMGFASISTDLYLPALPAMTAALGAEQNVMALTISGYLAGFSLGQLFWGPIGDRFGRRAPVAIGIALFIVGSAGCAVSGDAWQIVAWRVVQAAGASAGVVLGRAMVRDLYSGDRAAQMLSVLMTVMAVAPLLGPIAGGQILAVAGWRTIFVALTAIGLATLCAVAILPETLPARRRARGSVIGVMKAYADLVREPRIIGYAASGAFFYGGMFAYIAGTPFAYIDYHHVAPQLYGVLFAAGIVGIMVTNYLNARLVGRFGGARLLRFGAMLAMASGFLLWIDAITGFGGLAGLAAPLFIFVGATGFIVANSIAGAMADFPDRAGAVSALVGALQYGAGIVGSALVGAFADGTPRPMSAVIALAGAGAAICAFLLAPRPARCIKSPHHPLVTPNPGK